MNETLMLAKRSAFICFVTALLCSCDRFYDCDCYMSKGCATLKLKNNRNGEIIRSKIYCSPDNYYQDQSIKDSVKAYIEKYQTDSSTVFVNDSVYYNDQKIHLKSKQTGQYRKEGYDCKCKK